MPDKRHLRRDSLEGFDRKALRAALTSELGIAPNSAMFASRGNPWETTASEIRRENFERQRLEHQLRNAPKADLVPYKPASERDPNAPVYAVTKPLDGPPTPEQQRQLEDFVLSKLADAGPLPPVRVDKTKLALEKKIARPARLPGKGKFLKLAMKINQQAQLYKERQEAKEKQPVRETAGTDFGHFQLEKE